MTKNSKLDRIISGSHETTTPTVQKTLTETTELEEEPDLQHGHIANFHYTPFSFLFFLLGEGVLPLANLEFVGDPSWP